MLKGIPRWYQMCFIVTTFVFNLRKQKISEAELTYGSLSIDHSETMKEIGELGLDIWRRQMIEPLKVPAREKYLYPNPNFD